MGLIADSLHLGMHFQTFPRREPTAEMVNVELMNDTLSPSLAVIMVMHNTLCTPVIILYLLLGSIAILYNQNHYRVVAL